MVNVYVYNKVKKLNWWINVECFFYSIVIYGIYLILVYLCEVDGKVLFKFLFVVLIIEVGKVSFCENGEKINEY